MTLTLYFATGSPPSRAALLTARNLGLDIEIKHVDLRAREHLSEEFLKLNPQHQVPTLVDHLQDGTDFVVTESKAIQAYMVNSRAPGHSLYPTEPKARAVVDNRMYYDSTVVFARVAIAVRRVMLNPNTSITKVQKDEIHDIVKTLETYLEGKMWFAGEKLTIADLALLSSLSTLFAIGFDYTKFKNISRWFDTCRLLPGFDENEIGAQALGAFVKSKMTEPY